MSQMRMYCAGAGTIWVKVVGFNSSLDGTIQPSQTKQALHHYPRRSSHQNVSFQVVCRDSRELGTIQNFIRRHQKYALTSPANPEVVLSWPQRGIVDWSGVIKRVEAGDKRFNVTPRVNFTVDLVDSLLSRKTWWSSVADNFDQFFDNTLETPGEWTPPNLPSLPGATPGGRQDWGGGFPGQTTSPPQPIRPPGL